jgi:hypothetical protein
MATATFWTLTFYGPLARASSLSPETATETVWRPSQSCDGAISSVIAYSTGVCIEDEVVIDCSDDGSRVAVVYFEMGTNCTGYLYTRNYVSGGCNTGNRSGQVYSYAFVCAPAPSGGGGSEAPTSNVTVIICSVVAGVIALSIAAGAVYWRCRPKQSDATRVGSGAYAALDAAFSYTRMLQYDLGRRHQAVVQAVK